MYDEKSTELGRIIPIRHYVQQKDWENIVRDLDLHDKSLSIIYLENEQVGASTTKAQLPLLGNVSPEEQVIWAQNISRLESFLGRTTSIFELQNMPIIGLLGLVTGDCAKKHGYDRSNNTEERIALKAKSLGIPVSALETNEEQLMTLASIDSSIALKHATMYALSCNKSWAAYEQLVTDALMQDDPGEVLREAFLMHSNQNIHPLWSDRAIQARDRRLRKRIAYISARGLAFRIYVGAEHFPESNMLVTDLSATDRRIRPCSQQ